MAVILTIIGDHWQDPATTPAFTATCRRSEPTMADRTTSDRPPSSPLTDRIPRRRFLRATAGAGIVGTTAGCLGDVLDQSDNDGDAARTVFVFNQDQTVSAIDAATDEVLTTAFIGMSASLPANQYAIEATTEDHPILWLNTDAGATAIDARTFEEVGSVETSFNPNYVNLTPDGRNLVVASGGTSTRVPEPAHPTHTIARIDADPASSTFAEIIDELDYGKQGPCDMTIGPNGEYAYVPDVYEETFSVVSIDPLEVVGRVTLEPLVGDRTLPFMATASWDGSLVAVETPEGQPGVSEGRASTERFVDVTDPENPEEVASLTVEDGLGEYPLTSEFGPDDEFLYIFTLDSQDVTVVDLASFEVQTRIELGGPAITGTWEPNREKLYVPVMSGESVAVIDPASHEIVETVTVGDGPGGATAGRVRPATDGA